MSSWDLNLLTRFVQYRVNLSNMFRPFVFVLLVAGFANPLGASEQSSVIPQGADMVVLNAVIYQDSGNSSGKTSLAIKDGNILFMGTDASIQAWVDNHTHVLDAEGLYLYPGFIDTHVHVFEGASDIGADCELAPELNLQEQIPILEECAVYLTSPHQWLIGYGYQLDMLLSSDRGPSPRSVLDDLFPANPVIIMEESSHSMWVNSRALQLAAINETTEHPVGGRIMYEPGGSRLNGILFDNAGDMVMELAWNAQQNLMQRSYDGLLAGLDALAENGITTAGDGRLYWRRGWHQVWQKARSEGVLTARVALRPWIYPELPINKQIAELKKMQSLPGSSLLFSNQVKLYVDGVLHFGTARVNNAYAWSWQKNLPKGLYYIAPLQLEQWLDALNNIGYGAHIHAVGDKAISVALDTIGQKRRENNKQLFSLTHLEMLAKADVSKFNTFDIHADFQAGAAFFANHTWARDYLGRSRAKKLLPMRDAFNAGANITFSSDWTVNDLNPLVAIANSLRESNKQGLPDFVSALEAATINGAKALGIEHLTGSLEAGKSADFVLLSEDISRLTPDQIEQTEILMTVLAGDVVFEAE